MSSDSSPNAILSPAGLSSRSTAILIFFVTLLFTALPAGFAPFFTRGETREALVIRAMFDQGNFILPLRNGVDIPSKPPLFHWSAAFLSSLFNSQSEFVLRLPSALAAASTLAAFFILLIPYLGRRRAVLAVLILGSSLDWLRAADVTRVDMLFTCWTALGTWGLFELIEKYRKTAAVCRRTALAVSLTLALAALTKGPAGIALPWAVAGLYVLCVLPLREIPWKAAFACVLLSTVLAGLWYVAAYLQGGEAFLQVHLMRENVARVIGMKGYQTGHKANPLSILPMWFSGLLPWSMFLPALIVVLFRERRSLAADPLRLFCLLWLAFYLLFFACVSSKRNVYLLPCLPAGAILLTSAAERLADNASRITILTRVIFAVLVSVFALFCLVLLSSTFVDLSPLLTLLKVKSHDILIFSVVAEALRPFLPILFVCLLFCWKALRKYRREEFFGCAMYIAAGFLLAFATGQYSALNAVADYETPKPFLTQALRLLPPGAQLFQYDDDFFAANYYAGREVKKISGPPQLTNGEPGFMLLSESQWPAATAAFGRLEILDRSPTLNVYGRDRFVLVRFSSSPQDALHIEKDSKKGDAEKERIENGNTVKGS
jgi:4-amino-4-deoxy-L-arabinose transferase-like glycosyltransferase